jgi:hypothetical protein
MASYLHDEAARLARDDAAALLGGRVSFGLPHP